MGQRELPRVGRVQGLHELDGKFRPGAMAGKEYEREMKKREQRGQGSDGAEACIDWRETTTMED